MMLWWLQLHSNGLAPKQGQAPVPIFEDLGNLFLRTPMNVTVYGYMPVMFMCLGSAFWMILVSLLTPAPSRAVVAKFFPPSQSEIRPTA
jgi:hypothetical protein